MCFKAWFPYAAELPAELPAGFRYEKRSGWQQMPSESLPPAYL